MMSALCLFNEIQRACLVSSDLIPRTLSERIIKFTFSLLLRTNSSHQNCTKAGSWKLIHFIISKTVVILSKKTQQKTAHKLSTKHNKYY